MPTATIDDFRESGLAGLLLPARYGAADAHSGKVPRGAPNGSCGASSAGTLGFPDRHNWMLGAFAEQAEDQVFVDGPALCSVLLAPTGRARPPTAASSTGPWSWATEGYGPYRAPVGHLRGRRRAVSGGCARRRR